MGQPALPVVLPILSDHRYKNGYILRSFPHNQSHQPPLMELQPNYG